MPAADTPAAGKDDLGELRDQISAMQRKIDSMGRG